MQKKKINLALQGGGAHGAYTWGVLDALLDDGRLEFDGISGTSAGALNAVVMAHGLVQGGVTGAKSALEKFWWEVSHQSSMGAGAKSVFDVFLNAATPFQPQNASQPFFAFMHAMSNYFSPYDFNPLNINPLQSLIEQSVDFNALKSCDLCKIFISATNVHTGKVKVFTGNEITAQAVMASACLPLVFQAVEIDGVPYWDGGFMGNPVLFPFFYGTQTPDILLVQVNPVERLETPKTAQSIMNRMNEITFNASLLREFRAIDFVSRLIEQGVLDEKTYTAVRMHRIDATEELESIDASTKMTPEWGFLTQLRQLGYADAQKWLEMHYADIGIKATLDIRSEID